MTGVLLIVLGLGVAVESWRMPRMSEFGASLWSAPGIVPGMVGLLLALMGGVLHLRARAAGKVGPGRDDSLEIAAGPVADMTTAEPPATATGAASEAASTTTAAVPADGGAWRRVLITFVLCSVFAGVLVGTLPFTLAAFLFMLVFVLIFDHVDRRLKASDHEPGDAPPAATVHVGPFPIRRVLLAVVISAAMAFLVSLLFEDVFFVRLP